MKLTLTSSDQSPSEPICVRSIHRNEPNRPHISSRYQSCQTAQTQKSHEATPPGATHATLTSRILPETSAQHHSATASVPHPTTFPPPVKRYLGPTTKTRKRENAVFEKFPSQCPKLGRLGSGCCAMAQILVAKFRAPSLDRVVCPGISGPCLILTMRGLSIRPGRFCAPPVRWPIRTAGARGQSAPDQSLENTHLLFDPACGASLGDARHLSRRGHRNFRVIRPRPAPVALALKLHQP